MKRIYGSAYMGTPYNRRLHGLVMTSCLFRDRRWIVQFTAASDNCAFTTLHLLFVLTA